MHYLKDGLVKKWWGKPAFRLVRKTSFIIGMQGLDKFLDWWVWILTVFFFSPNGKKFRSKPQLVRYLGDTVDLTTFDFKTGKINAILLRKNRKKAQPDLARGFRNDLSIIPPIRQTASIFKQPVTIVKSQECKVRHELKHGRQEKPRQVQFLDFMYDVL